MTHEHAEYRSSAAVPGAILAVLILYAISALLGLPQAATHQLTSAEHHAEHHEAPESADSASSAAGVANAAPPLWTVLPFALLLGAIAVLPLIPATEHWWESNLHRFYVAAGLALVTLAYYAFLHRAPLDGHFPAHHVVTPSDAPVQIGFVKTVLENAILQEFIPFIVLLFSLFTITGGIRITGDLRAHPATNATILGIGALLASFIGTTGAAMLLIRLLLETNRERKHVVHTVVFFILIVCNCGGLLLPLGDPPLFLGYLQGVPFLWTLRLWPEWLFVNGLLILVYLLLDGLWHYRRETVRDIQRDETRTHAVRVGGWQINAPLLVCVVVAVGLLDPSKAVPGTDWHPWMYLREAVLLALVAISLWFGGSHVRAANQFNYSAIIEVAALFFGIFITMQPALQILHVRGAELGVTEPIHFFWATGILSSVLDNAPTYLVFFQTAQSIHTHPEATMVVGVEESILAAISLGAVMMGAMTYIGNGPNFMVRAIAAQSGVRMPSFFGYMVYSCAILLPILAAMVWLFLT